MDEAIADFNEAIRINPNNKMAYVNRGVAKSTKADYKGAFEDYSDVIRIAPDGASYFNRGVIRTELKDLKGAVEDFNVAIKLEPKDPLYWYTRGNLKVSLKNIQGACDDYNRAISLGMSSSDISYYQTKCRIKI